MIRKIIKVHDRIWDRFDPDIEYMPRVVILLMFCVITALVTMTICMMIGTGVHFWLYLFVVPLTTYWVLFTTRLAVLHLKGGTFIEDVKRYWEES